MLHLRHPCFIALHSQHAIQSHDVLKISDLANAEGIVNNIEAYSFDEFLGLTIYLFVTTQSQSIREELSFYLSKFGSAAVLPLIQILCRIQLPANVRQLARQSLDDMELYPLIIGLSHILEREIDNILRTAAMEVLVKISQENNQSILLLLPKVLSKKTWQALKDKLSMLSPSPKNHQSCPDRKVSFKLESYSKDDKQHYAFML